MYASMWIWVKIVARASSILLVQGLWMLRSLFYLRLVDDSKWELMMHIVSSVKALKQLRLEFCERKLTFTSEATFSYITDAASITQVSSQQNCHNEIYAADVFVLRPNLLFYLML
jgi:hypothetical protein